MEIRTSYSYEPLGKPFRSKIHDLQDLLMQQPDNMSPEDAEEEFVEHYFAPYTYARKMFIAKDMCVVGKIHKHAHLNILLHGKCKVVTEFGDEFLEGPRIWTSEPGTKRAVFALTDLEWVTVHHNPTGGTDTSEIEKYVIAKDYEELERLKIESGDDV